MSDFELFSISDFLVMLFRRVWVFFAVLALVLIATAVYLEVAKKSYRLRGTIYVGRFQEILLEEGEFVAKKLEDYSFIKKALENHGVTLDMPVARLEKFIHTDVVNEVKKIKDVGIVELTVEYKDAEKCHAIFKALTDQLISDHKVLFVEGRTVFDQMVAQFEENERILAEGIEEDERFAYGTNRDQRSSQSVPSHLLIRHTISEKREFLKKLIQDRHYLMIESNSATKSYNTKLSAEPQVPDESFKPKKVLTWLVGIIFGCVAGVAGAFMYDMLVVEVFPKLRKART